MQAPAIPKTTLCASDLDFTLLRNDATLSARTIEVINEMVSRGHKFTYATARSYASASQVTSGLRLNLPLITYGGAVLVRPPDGLITDVTPLPAEAVAAIIMATAHDTSVEPLLFTMIDGRDRVCWRESRAGTLVQSFLATRQGDPRLLPLADWSQISPTSVFYATLIGDRQDIAAVRTRIGPRLDRCFFTIGPDAYNPDQTWLEITSRNATKAAAASRLAREYKVDHLIAFGDNLNDAPLFETADYACAVANAVPDLLAIADEVIGTNEADGVAEWLARRFLEGQPFEHPATGLWRSGPA